MSLLVYVQETHILVPPLKVIIMDALDPDKAVEIVGNLYHGDHFIESLYNALSEEGVVSFSNGMLLLMSLKIFEPDKESTCLLLPLLSLLCKLARQRPFRILPLSGAQQETKQR